MVSPWLALMVALLPVTVVTQLSLRRRLTLEPRSPVRLLVALLPSKVVVHASEPLPPPPPPFPPPFPLVQVMSWNGSA